MHQTPVPTKLPAGRGPKLINPNPPAPKEKGILERAPGSMKAIPKIRIRGDFTGQDTERMYRRGANLGG